MSEREKKQPDMPPTPFKLLLVEGGDEKAVCEWLIGKADWPSYCCWTASGQDKLPVLAQAARRAPNFEFAASVGAVLDIEANNLRALEVAESTFRALGVSPPMHAQVVQGPRRHGVFLCPDGVSPGAIETLCREAATKADAARCVDTFESCRGVHVLPSASQTAKRWVNAYIEGVLGPRNYLPKALEEGLFDPQPFSNLKRFLLAL